jgi:hypothetical protein
MNEIRCQQNAIIQKDTILYISALFYYSFLHKRILETHTQQKTEISAH